MAYEQVGGRAASDTIEGDLRPNPAGIASYTATSEKLPASPENSDKLEAAEPDDIGRSTVAPIETDAQELLVGLYPYEEDPVGSTKSPEQQQTSDDSRPTSPFTSCSDWFDSMTLGIGLCTTAWAKLAIDCPITHGTHEL